MGRDMSAISLQDLDISYGATKVVSGVNIEVAEGESFALVGESGSGKSTILRAIAGLAPDWTGAISVLGAPRGHMLTAILRHVARWCSRTPTARCIRARRSMRC